MAVENRVREEVIKAFQKHGELDMMGLMKATGRGRIVYKYVQLLMEQKVLSLVREEQTKTKPRRVYRYDQGTGPYNK